MKYDRSFFDTPVDRMGTNCEKWDALRRREGSDLLPMWRIWTSAARTRSFRR